LIVGIFLVTLEHAPAGAVLAGCGLALVGTFAISRLRRQ